MSQDQTQAKVKAALNGLGVPTPTFVSAAATADRA